MTKKKRKKHLFRVYSSLPTNLDIKQAAELINTLDKMIAEERLEIKFEHLLLWWINCDEADA